MERSFMVDIILSIDDILKRYVGSQGEEEKEDTNRCNKCGWWS